MVFLPVASDGKPPLPFIALPFPQNPEKWQQAFWNSLKSAFQNTRPVWGLGFLEVEGRAVWFDCTVCSSAMTQLLYNPHLCTHDLQTQQNSCSAPKLSAGAACHNAAGQSLLLSSYSAKSHRT